MYFPMLPNLITSYDRLTFGLTLQIFLFPFIFCNQELKFVIHHFSVIFLVLQLFLVNIYLHVIIVIFQVNLLCLKYINIACALYMSNFFFISSFQSFVWNILFLQYPLWDSFKDIGKNKIIHLLNVSWLFHFVCCFGLN